MATPETLRLLTDVRTTLASSSLTADQAKLYSQRLRRQMGRPGLRSFTDTAVRTALDHATLLLESALIERASGQPTNWTHGVKRAADILSFFPTPISTPVAHPYIFSPRRPTKSPAIRPWRSHSFSAHRPRSPSLRSSVLS